MEITRDPNPATMITTMTEKTIDIGSKTIRTTKEILTKTTQGNLITKSNSTTIKNSKKCISKIKVPKVKFLIDLADKTTNYHIILSI